MPLRLRELLLRRELRLPLEADLRIRPSPGRSAGRAGRARRRDGTPARGLRARWRSCVREDAERQNPLK
ncbi:hypothetical protein AKJ09_08396 [Labilithrix luteola]|uniref:Uncharacterized protein n=1 Tax=Labilithrix luteola TaxID=1391654 RepID=A0A0K1Q7M0_9BACT|nr:hypothetical protein AKJ09_08396 [Labilithrix luteola]